MKYFARINKETVGPLSLKELVEAGLRPSTYIWYKGLDDWQRAEEDPDICRGLRRYLAGYDPETGELPEAQVAKEEADPKEEMRQMAEQGMFGLRGLPEPPDRTDYTAKPMGVSVITALLATLFCFPITGLIAVFFAMRCSAYWKMSEQPGIADAERRDYQIKSHSHARVYKMMLGITLCLGLIMAGIAFSRALG